MCSDIYECSFTYLGGIWTTDMSAIQILIVSLLKNKLQDNLGLTTW